MEGSVLHPHLRELMHLLLIDREYGVAEVGISHGAESSAESLMVIDFPLCIKVGLEILAPSN